MEKSSETSDLWKKALLWGSAAVAVGGLAVGIRHQTVDATRSQFDRGARTWLADHGIDACTASDSDSTSEVPCLEQVKPSDGLVVVATNQGNVNVFCDIINTNEPACYISQSDGRANPVAITGPGSFDNL